MSSAWSSAATTAPTVSGPISCPPSTSSTSSSTTARGGDLLVLALDRQLVAAQAESARQAGAQRVEHAVAHSGELRDLVRDGEGPLHARLSVGAESPARRQAEEDSDPEGDRARAGARIDVPVGRRRGTRPRRRVRALVELLTDPESIDDETFAEIAPAARSSSAPARWPRSPPAGRRRAAGPRVPRAGSRAASGANASSSSERSRAATTG